MKKKHRLKVQTNYAQRETQWETGEHKKLRETKQQEVTCDR